jgi:hypothetical protein
VGLDVVKDESGFTISFKQEGQPEVLRLYGEPIDISHPEELAGQWTHPDRPQRVTLASIALDGSKSCLKDEILQLEVLNAQSHDLQRKIAEKKHRIQQLLHDDLRKFRSTIKNCGSLKCIFRTTMHKVPEYAHIVSLHFRHHRPSSQVTVSSQDDAVVEGMRKQGSNAIMYGGAEATAYDSESSQSFSQHDEIDDPSPPMHKGRPSTSVSEYESASGSPSPSHTRPVSATSVPHRNGSDTTPPSPKSHNIVPPSSQFSHKPFHQYKLLKYIIATLFFLIILSILTFLTLRHFNLLCTSPKCRSSRASSREERRTRRACRRAAHQHAWRKWWSRYRRPTCPNDYEEKRTLILEQEGVLENAMQDEIRGLSLVQGIAAELVRAEEGRARLYHQANMLPQQHVPTSNAAEQGASSENSPSPTTAPVFRTVDSFSGYPRRPSFASSTNSDHSRPPPSYEQELEGDIDVVDGFSYSRTFGGGYTEQHTHTFDDGYVYGIGDVDDATPDSSVVDCSPRMSFDTGRSSLTTGKERD